MCLYSSVYIPLIAYTQLLLTDELITKETGISGSATSQNRVAAPVYNDDAGVPKLPSSCIFTAENTLQRCVRNATHHAHHHDWCYMSTYTTLVQYWT